MTPESKSAAYGRFTKTFVFTWWKLTLLFLLLGRLPLGKQVRSAIAVTFRPLHASAVNHDESSAFGSSTPDGFKDDGTRRSTPVSKMTCITVLAIFLFLQLFKLTQPTRTPRSC